MYYKTTRIDLIVNLIFDCKFNIEPALNKDLQKPHLFQFLLRVTCAKLCKQYFHLFKKKLLNMLLIIIEHYYQLTN